MRNTFYWDKKKMLDAPGDYTKATIYHFLHSYNMNATSGVLESMKEPLENREWYKSGIIILATHGPGLREPATSPARSPG